MSTPRTLISSVPSVFVISRLSAFKSREETSRTSNAVRNGLFDQ